MAAVERTAAKVDLAEEVMHICPPHPLLRKMGRRARVVVEVVPI